MDRRARRPEPDIGDRIDDLPVPSGAINLESPPATPRPSATVLLIRGRKPWELLLMRRPGGADFAPGAYVFPGGTVHPEDSESGDEIAMAAVRELFEEVGILVARSQGRLAREADCQRVRAQLEGGSTFSRALRACRLKPAFDRLVFLARWVTPAQLRLRYDARFFLTRLPVGQVVRPQEGEVTDWLWISPQRALADPRVTLVYATRTVLESVVTSEDSTSLMARVRPQKDAPIVEPRLVQTESGWTIEQ
jgi:8-oxo-dGTP pyrophosphatase MutT (NUDIX family)